MPTIQRKRLGHVTDSGETIILHFETSAKVVLMEDGTPVEDKLNNVSTVVNQTMQPLKDAVDKLNGDSAVTGSVDQKIKAITDPISNKQTNLETTHTQDMNRLDGNVDVNGSVYYKINEKVTPLKQILDELTGAGSEGGGGSIDDRITTAINPVQSAIDKLNGDITTTGSVDKKLEDRVSPIETLLAKLNGPDTETGSIKQLVADAVATIVADAPEDLNDLLEVSNWIHTHESDASAMNTAITDLRNALTALTTRVTAVEESQATYQIQEL